MIFILFLLKSLIVLGINIGFGYLISYCFHFYFFYPRKLYLFNRYHFPFSPGLLHRKKKVLIDYLHNKLNEYYNYTKQDYFQKNFLTDFENKIYNEIYPFVSKFLEKEWIPSFLHKKLLDISSNLTWSVIYKITRVVFPKSLHEFQVDQKIDMLDIKLDIYKLRELFEEYVYKYFLYFNLTFFTVVGLMNMIVFMVLA